MIWLLAALATAGEAPWQEPGWGWGGLPAVNYNTDEGLGFGLVASAYRYDGEQSPYKTAVDLIVFATTKAIQGHTLQVDALDVGGLPIRLTIRGDLIVTGASNYCGVGPHVTCDPAAAEEAVDVTGPAREDALRRYYRVRFVYPQLRADLRWALDPMPHKVEVLAGWRGGLLIPGDLGTDEPFEPSLYATDFPGGERERTSVLQVGLMADDRDFEPAPTRGYWVEGSIRGASRYWGATYAYVGFNTTLRGYLPLGTDRLVLAERAVFDGQAGDLPTTELAVPGGSQRYDWYGSLNAGRGIRLRRYIGRVMAMNQAELRWTFARPEVWGAGLDLAALAFSDVGFVAADWDHLGQLGTPLPGQGGGIRVGVDGNFVVRADVAVSALEDWVPSVYIDIDNTF